MPRNLTSTVLTALDAQNVPALVLVEMDFDSGTVRLCNASYPFNWNGYTWTGAGELMKINPIEESAQLQALGLNVQLSGIPSTLISLALSEPYQGRNITVLFAPLDANYNILATPVIAFIGRMDVMNIEMDATAVITMTAESRFSDWDRPRVRRYTQEDQQIDYPGDNGLEFVPQMAERPLIWGLV